MKLRVRFSSGGSTHRIEVPDNSDLRTLRARIASTIESPLGTGDIRLSLNKRDELSGPDSVSLAALGICNGDLLYLLLGNSSGGGARRSINNNNGSVNPIGQSDRRSLSAAPLSSSSPTPSPPFPSPSSSPRLGVTASAGGNSRSDGFSPSSSSPSPSSSGRRRVVEAAGTTGSGSPSTTAAFGPLSSSSSVSLGRNTAGGINSLAGVQRVSAQRPDPAAFAATRRELCAAAALARQAAVASSSSPSAGPSPSSSLLSPATRSDGGAQMSGPHEGGGVDQQVPGGERMSVDSQSGGERMAVDSQSGVCISAADRSEGMDVVVVDGDNDRRNSPSSGMPPLRLYEGTRQGSEPVETAGGEGGGGGGIEAAMISSLMQEDETSTSDPGLLLHRSSAADGVKDTAMAGEEPCEGGGGSGGEGEQHGAAVVAAPDILERVLSAEVESVKTNHDLLVIAVHAAMLETGMVPHLPGGHSREGVGGDGVRGGEDMGGEACPTAAGGNITPFDVRLPARWTSVEGALTVVYSLSEVVGEVERESRAVKCSLCFRSVGGCSVVYGTAAAAVDSSSGCRRPVVHRLSLRHNSYCTDDGSSFLATKQQVVGDSGCSHRRAEGSLAVKRTRVADGGGVDRLHIHDQQHQRQQEKQEQDQERQMMEEDEREAVGAASTSFPAMARQRREMMLLTARRRFSNLRGLWKEVKDCLALPLLMTLRQRAGIPPPPSLLAVPSDLKMRILELLPAVDLAAVGCTCSELRFLASDDHLWHRLFVRHFGIDRSRIMTSGGQTWKTAFARAWRRSAEEKRRREEERRGGLVLVPMPRGLVPRGGNSNLFRHPGRIVGGDYDRLPGGGFGLLHGRGGGATGGLGDPYGAFSDLVGGEGALMSEGPFGRGREEGRAGEGLRFRPHAAALSEVGLPPGHGMEPSGAGLAVVSGGDGLLNLGPGLLGGPHVMQPGLGIGLAPPPHGSGVGGQAPTPRGPSFRGLGGPGGIL